MGPGSHRRRSSVKTAVSLNRVAEESNGHNAGIFEALRRYSLMPFEDQTPEKARRASRPPEIAEEVPLLSSSAGQERKHSSKDLLQNILDRASVQLPRTASPSIAQERLVMRKKSGKGRDTVQDSVPCAEDWRPHVCLDEQLTPVTFSGGSSSLTG
ncbi:hypothetical protein SLS62_005785 [Diatrype stigma]|uniref:Uncharacterized protein n=1 Tax=Diatrype stigma TaxID=117547 RepID=A0AAN9US46_9PEZI